MPRKREQLEKQLADFLAKPSMTVALVIIGEIDLLAKRVDQLEKEVRALRATKREQRG